MKGHRVRLRVVAEREVALLAESEDDAKARAEADLSSADYTEIQDEWPPKRVSVKTIAVERYPALALGAVRGDDDGPVGGRHARGGARRSGLRRPWRMARGCCSRSDRA
jgi:hypothetical protein